MAGCRIVNQGVLTALDSIESCRASFEEAGQTLISSLTSAIADMEGAAKDAFQALHSMKLRQRVQAVFVALILKNMQSRRVISRISGLFQSFLIKICLHIIFSLSLVRQQAR